MNNTFLFFKCLKLLSRRINEYTTLLAFLVDECPVFFKFADGFRTVNFWLEILLVFGVMVHRVTKLFQSSSLKVVFGPIIRRCREANHVDLFGLCFLVERPQVFEHAFIGLVDDHDSGLRAFSSVEVSLVPHSTRIVLSCLITVCLHLFVALSINLHESFVLKDYVNIIISVLKEKIGESRVNLTLSLAGRNHPNLLRKFLVVQVGK